MEKLNNLYKECLTELDSIGIKFYNKDIDVNLSNRNNKRYGCCKPEVPDENYKKIEKKRMQKNN